MSYTKVYARQFLRVGDRYLPICLFGCSNVTEFVHGREVYERSWDSFVYDDSMILTTKEEIMDCLRRRIEASGYIDGFRFHSKWVSGDGILRFFENGMKNAITVEELAMQSHYAPTVTFTGYTKNSVHPERDVFYIHSSQDLEDVISKIKTEKTNPKWTQAYINCSFPGRTGLAVYPFPDLPDNVPVIIKTHKRNGWGVTGCFVGGAIEVDRVETVPLVTDAHKFQNVKEAVEYIRCHKHFGIGMEIIPLKR